MSEHQENTAVLAPIRQDLGAFLNTQNRFEESRAFTYEALAGYRDSVSADPTDCLALTALLCVARLLACMSMPRCRRDVSLVFS